jgi:hypothetical protein
MYYLKAYIPDEIEKLRVIGDPLKAIPDFIEILKSDENPTLLLRKKYN